MNPPVENTSASRAGELHVDDEDEEVDQENLDNGPPSTSNKS
jgi:hypothetical protein